MVEDAIVVEEHTRIERAYREQSQRMWRALFGYTGDPEIASDALAESFARALRFQGEIRDLSAWTWRVAFRVAAAELRRRRDSMPATEATGYTMPEPVPELVTALRALSPNQRLAVVLHDYGDRSTAEVAAIIGCSRATVHVHLSQGRHRLRDLLEDQDD
jgi:DNA-directed RNA polymerase specialized sigma24 family protein